MRQLLRSQQTSPSPICAHLQHWLTQHPQIHTVAAYAALPGEIDLSSLIAHHPQIRWAFPRVTGTTLKFHQITNPLEQLVSGYFKILEPSPTLPEIEISQIDAFLCPGLAFDPMGGRLGRGKGFYDRILAHARPDALKIGVCHHFQQVPNTFSEPHDILMNQVICIS